MITFFYALIGYLIGSFPTGKIVASSYGIDIETVGSGNVGATNLARVVGKQAGLITLFVDIFKGLLVVLLGNYLDIGPVMAITVVLGHCYSLPGLKGGKGVATALGAILGLSWILGLTAIGIFALVFTFTQFVSVSSITAALITPIVSFFIFPFADFNISLAVIGFLITFRHRENIERLVLGNEKKFSFAK